MSRPLQFATRQEVIQRRTVVRMRLATVANRYKDAKSAMEKRIEAANRSLSDAATLLRGIEKNLGATDAAICNFEFVGVPKLGNDGAALANFSEVPRLARRYGVHFDFLKRQRPTTAKYSVRLEAIQRLQHELAGHYPFLIGRKGYLVTMGTAEGSIDGWHRDLDAIQQELEDSLRYLSMETLKLIQRVSELGSRQAKVLDAGRFAIC